MGHEWITNGSRIQSNFTLILYECRTNALILYYRLQLDIYSLIKEKTICI